MPYPSVLCRLLCVLSLNFGFAIGAFAQTPFPMSSGDFAEDFADIANTTNWPNGFNGPSSTAWNGLAINATGTIPDGVRVSSATTSFVTSSSGGVQRGTENIQLLSTGATDNTTAAAIDLNLNFTGRNAGTLSFDAATVFNGSGNRAGTLRVYTSADGVTFTELTGVGLPFVSTNNVAGSASITAVSLPASLNGVGAAKIRFYYHNGTGGSSGSRPKISIDNLTVTSTPGAPAQITSPVAGETAVFTATYGVASAVQTFAVAGTDLSGPITATAPAGFEVSNDGTVWGATAAFAPAAGVVAGATLSVRLAATAAVAGSYNAAVIALTTPGATGVNLTTPATGSSVSAAALTITANDVTKPFGQVLSEVNPGSTAFVPSGLVNGETVGTVTITYTDGFAAIAPAALYADAVVPSAAVGGSFDIGNYSVTYVPGDLTVSADPVVTLTGTFTAMSTEYGTASVAQTASVSGAGLTANLIVSAPTGYEVSLAEATGYEDTLTLTPVANAVADTTVYLRIKANTPAGVVAAGVLSAASAGATTQTLTVLVGNVDAKVLTILGLEAEDKEYDRTPAATLTGTGELDGVVAGDEADVVLGGTAEAAFGQFTPGTGLNVTVTGFSLSGTKSANYTLAPLVLVADIIAKELTLAGAAVVTRAFNGTTAATITGTLSGVIDPDVVGFTGAGSFDNVGPGAPIPVTANLVLTGANAGNYILLQPTGLTGRINGGGAGSVITQWTFEGDVTTPAVGSGTASLIGGTAATFAAGSGGGRAWNLNTFPAVGANSGTAGAEFAVSTAGSSGITMTFEHRGSGTSSRWARVDYSLDGGNNWVTDFWNNHDEANGGRATGIAPDSSFYLFTVNFSSVPGADNNPLFRARIVSIFSPVEFTANSLPYAANAAYRPSGTSGTAAYSTGGTWRFDNVTFTGNPPFQFLGSTPDHLATEVSPDSTIQLNFTKPATLTGTAVTLVDGASNPIPFTGLPVTEGQSVVTLTPVSRLPYGEQITLTMVRDQITSGAETLDSTTATIPVVFTTEVAVTPVVEVTPAALEAPINTTATLTANVTAGSAPVTLQWYEGEASNFGAATLLTGQTGTTLEVTNATVGVRSFFVRATSAAGESVNSNTVAVAFTNFTLVTATLPAANATGVLPNSTISLTFSKPVKIAPGGVSLSPAVAFTIDPVFDAAAFHTTYVLTPSVALAANTLYTVTVDKDLVTAEDAVGMAANVEFDFTTLQPVEITLQPLSQTVFAGSNATISVTVVGDGPLDYDWRLNGDSLGAPSSPTLTLNNVQIGQSGSYSVVVTGPGDGNSQVSDEAVLTVTLPSITLTGTSYTQNFDGVSAGLPFGWSVYTGASLSAVGNPAAFNVNPVEWAATAGSFRNSASATGLLGDDVLATQNASTNRAIGVRQTGGFGDPGASFNVALTTLGKNITGLSFKAQLLSSQARSTTWSVQVGLGAAPTSWETLGVFNDPGAFGSTDIVFTEVDLAKMTNQPFVWVRIVALNNSLGGGSRDTFGIDDFSLTYEDDLAPLAWDANGATPGAGGPTPAGIWGTDAFWSGSALGDAVTDVWVAGGKAAFSAGDDATGVFTVSLAGEQEARWVIFEEGEVTLTGGALRLTSGAPRLLVDAPLARIDSEIRGSTGFIKVGAGTLQLGQANTFTGTVTLAGGALEISDPLALGDAANDVRLGGTLRVLQSMAFGVDRVLTGAGAIEFSNSAALTLNGEVNTIALELAGAGEAIFAGASNAVGNLTLSGEADTSGAPLTLTNLSGEAGSSVIGNEITFANSIATVAVDTGASLRLNGPITMTNVAVTDRLIKTGEGTLVLPVANPNLYKLALGVQGTVPVNGGRVQIDDKAALGTSMSFLNYGTLEFLRPMTEANALDIGFSFSGRTGSPLVIEGEDLVLNGASAVYGAAQTSGPVVAIINNHTTIAGTFVRDATTVGPISTFRVEGTGKLTLSGSKSTYRLGLSVADSLTVELDTEQIGDDPSSFALISVENTATLHPGTDGGARLVQAYTGLIVDPDAAVVFDLLNTTRGAGYDAIDLAASSANLSVSGKVEVRFGSGFVPQAGQSFQLFSWSSGASVTLNASSLELPTVEAPLAWNTSLFASNGVIFIEGPGMGPVITVPPVSQSVIAGDPVQFSVGVSGDGPFTYQWLFNGQPISGAPNSPSYNLGAVTVGRMGAYSVTVTNSIGSTTSSAAILTVEGAPFISVPPQSRAVEDGTEVTFGFEAVGIGPFSQQWQYQSNAVAANWADLDGQTGPTLTVTASDETHGRYRVRVTNDFGQTTSAEAVLSPPRAGPPNQRPAWDFTGDLPPGQIGLAYSFTLAVLPDDPANNVLRSADSFSAVGLPTGLRIDTLTGVISGVPAAIKATPYAVTVTARNGFGTAVLRTRILIQPLPSGALGVFTGPVARSGLLPDVAPFNNGALGGRFDMTVAATGRATGSVTIGMRRYAFRSALVIDTSTANRATLTAEVRRPRLANLVVNVTVDTLNGTVVEGLVSDGNATATFTGWRNPWSRLALPATSLAGYYTTKLELTDGALTSAQAPIGAGFVSFAVSATTGRLTLRGRLADGSAITMATFAGPAGQILLFRPLYASTARGSILGQLGIVAEPEPKDNTVEGDLEWFRPANGARSNRLYRDGFPAPGVVDLTATGAVYEVPPVRNSRNPTADSRVLGLTDSANEIEVLLTGGGVETALPLMPEIKANVAFNNRVTFNPDPLVNTRRLVLSFVAKTGAFTGRFTLSENDVTLLPVERAVVRTVAFQGLIVDGVAEGYFIVNQLPAVVGVDTPANTAQQGGKVVVQPVAPLVGP
jgi:autotransporter-associated beta strand protein